MLKQSFLALTLSSSILTFPISAASAQFAALLKQSHAFARQVAASPYRVAVTEIINKTDFRTSCTKLADRLITNREQIDWRFSPYSYFDEQDRIALQDIYTEAIMQIKDARYQKVQIILQDFPLFTIIDTGNSVEVDLSLTLSAIYRHEMAHFDAFKKLPHVEQVFEEQRRDRVETLRALTASAVRQFPENLAKAAGRIDAEV